MNSLIPNLDTELPESFTRKRDRDQVAGRYAYFVIAAFFVPVLILIVIDRRVWPWDEAFYGEYSVWLLRTLVHSPSHWPAALMASLGDRAPAISWVGEFFVPLGYAFPNVQTGLLLCILLTQLTSVLLLYWTIRKASGSILTALITSGIASSGSLFVGLTYHYFVEPLQLLCVVSLLALAVYHRRFSRTILATLTIAAFVFGLLVKTSTPAFQAPLLLYLVYLCFHKQPPALTPHGLCSGKAFHYLTIFVTALIVLATFAWYFLNFRGTLQHVMQAASGDLAIYYGSKANLTVKLSFWMLQLQKSFLYLPVLGALLIAVPKALLTRWQGRGRLTQFDFLAILSLVWLAVLIFLFSRNINEETRYLLALLPYVGTIIGWIVFHCKSPILLLLLAAMTSVQFIAVNAQSFAFIAPRPGLNGWLQPYVSDPTALQDSLFCVDKTADVTVQLPGIVGVELPEFNEVGLSFYAVIKGHSLEPGTWFYNGFDWTQADPSIAWQRVRQINARYFIYRKHDKSLDLGPINHLATAELQKVRQDPQFRFRADKSNQRVLVYERTDIQSSSVASPSHADLYRILSAGFQGTNPENKLPFGLLEYPSFGATLQTMNSLSMHGWAVSPSGVARIEVLLDGVKAIDAAKTDRPDVHKAYPALKSTGFEGQLDFSKLPDGPHRILVRVHGTDGSSRIIADVAILNHIDFPGVGPQGNAPFGFLDVPKAAEIVDATRPLLLQGWAASKAGIDHVEILLDGRHAANATRNKRDDVAKVFPDFRSTGFEANVNFRPETKGAHRLSIVSHSNDGNSRVVAQVTLIFK